MQWNEICITDKTGKKFWNTSASEMSTISELKNLKRHLIAIKQGNPHYKSVDTESACINLNGQMLSLEDVNQLV